MNKALPKIIRIKPFGGRRLEFAFSDRKGSALDFSWLSEGLLRRVAAE